MFFVKWLTALIVSLIINAGVFAFIDYFTKGAQMQPAAVASVASFISGAVFLIALFPPSKRKRK